MMKHKLSFLFFLLILPAQIYFSNEFIHAETHNVTFDATCHNLYEEMELDSVVNYEPFKLAISGLQHLNVENKDTITVIDFSLPSTVERFFVLDLKNKKMLFSSLVAHGKRSGDNFATSFSNKKGSHKSSLGFYLTGNTYKGGNGYSLLLNGLEKGINDNARTRSIVIHGANYCSQNIIDSSGRLGRSFGCPALPYNISQPIIDTIKEGTVLFIYADNLLYKRNSKLI